MTTAEDRTSGTTGMAQQQSPGVGNSELREGYADIGDQRLHYVEAGDGPLIVLLHGFPEFWYGWRLQIQPLAAAGFRVVAPDMRGYNLSSKPDGVKAYDIDQLTAESAASSTNAAPSPRCWPVTTGAEASPGPPRWPTRRSWTGWPSSTRPTRGSSRRDCTTPASSGSPGTSSSLTSRSCPRASCTPTAGISSGTSCATPARAYTPEEIDRYVEAWSQPGAATGMINYYRSSVRTPPKQAEAALRPSLGAHPGHLGTTRSLPRPRTSRARPRRRAQPRPRRAPARRVTLGASRRA